MKLLSREEEAAHYRTTLTNGIGGGILGLGVGIAGVYGASWRYPAFRHLTLPFKTFLVTSSATFAAIITADRASRAFESSRHPEEQYRDQAARQQDEAAKQKPVFQRFLAWGKENRYPIVGASWVASMGLAFAIVGRNPYLTTSQKIVQARVYAQGLTLAVLIATAAFEIGDRENSDGMWETVKVVDPNDPEHKHLIEKRIHHESYQGEDLWKDMVEAEERRIKEREQEIKEQEERDAKAGKHKHKKHDHHETQKEKNPANNSEAESQGKKQVTVKHENFKTCAQSGFCNRNRAFADNVNNLGSSFQSPYIFPSRNTLRNGKLSTILRKEIKRGDDKGTVNLPLELTFLESGVARLTINEERRMIGGIEKLRRDSKARKERYDEVEKWVLVGGLDVSTTAEMTEEAGQTRIKYGPSKEFECLIVHVPFRVEFKRNGETHVQFNGRSLLNYEHWLDPRDYEEKTDTGSTETEGEEATPPETPSEDQSTWWDESFGGNTDSKPKGPEAVAMDISFPGYEHVFGIPEHASSMSLKETRGGDGNYHEPYRLYNADVFEYEVDSPMTLYGAIPFMQAHRKDSTVGVFWLNAAESWIDIVKSKPSINPLSLGAKVKTTTHTHWMFESGLLDVFVFLGPTPKSVTKAYGELTGYSQLPQYFSIAYHQSRWNYVNEEDVKNVDRKFDKHQIPYDVIWLDIEHTNEKKYLTWNPDTFGDPIGMQKQLDNHKRKLVTIVDPHIKNVPDYFVADELKSKSLAVKNKDGDIYEGWCWPGSSHWVDCFNPAAIEWWTTLFKYDRWKGSMHNTFLWNDMNEPSVFNGPETTMPKDNLHHDGWEHRDLHNLNGLTFINASYQALLERKKGEVRRPFVLTRSFFAGSQRLGPMWTGDNLASWDHLAASMPMVLNNGISGFPFAGADVAGFFGNPEKELLARWYQTGIFYPFFRGHAHIDTRRREPYLLGEPYVQIVAQALRLRYALLPAWYTAFHEASVDGTPILRPHYYQFPSDEQGFAIDDQFYVGSTGLLVKPVVQEGARSVDIYIPDNEPYYDYFDYTIVKGPGFKNMLAPLEKIPILVQGGHIIPRRDRPRRSSGLMHWDPFTLVVALDSQGNAAGTLYLDDGESFDYEVGGYIHRQFRFSQKGKALVSEDIARHKGKKTQEFLDSMKDVRVERIILIGLPQDWSVKNSVKVSEEKRKPWTAKIDVHPAEGGKASWAVIQKPKVAVGSDWKVDFS